MRSTRLENLFIIRSHKELAGAEIELAQQGNHLTHLRDVLEKLRPLALFDPAGLPALARSSVSNGDPALRASGQGTELWQCRA